VTWLWVVLILGLVAEFIALTAFASMHERKKYELEKWNDHEMIELGMRGQEMSESRSLEDDD